MKQHLHTLGLLIVGFFEEYLGTLRDISPHTVASYSYCIKLLLDFCTQRFEKTHDALAIEDIDEEIILAFLDYLETVRGNLPQTRNNRLFAIHTFFRFLVSKDPTLLDVCQRVCDIKAKKVPHQVQTTLTVDEVNAFLSASNPNVDGNTCKPNADGNTRNPNADGNTRNPNADGNTRDYALFYMLYNTGARVSELVDLKLGDFRFEAPAHVKLTGKGSKQRYVPLWKDTVTALKAYLVNRDSSSHSDPLFLNQQKVGISRFGIRHLVRKYKFLAEGLCPTLREKTVTPHTFRHAIALHLIQSNVDITQVKNWLGHANINTTNLYIDIDMDMKQKALDACNPPDQGPQASTPIWKQPAIKEFLIDLTRSV